MRAYAIAMGMTALIVAGVIVNPFWLYVFGAMAQGVLNGLLERPVMWGAFLGIVVSLSLVVFEMLEHRGVRAAGWAVLWACCVGVLAAVTP